MTTAASCIFALVLRVLYIGSTANALSLDLSSSRRGFIRTAAGVVGGTSLLPSQPALSAPPSGKKPTTCVTGANGYIGLHTVSQLLLSGYAVRAALRSTSGVKTKWLTKVASDLGASDRLTFATIDLADAGSMADAARGCDSLIHLASPFELGKTANPIKDILEPAVAGWTNAVAAADALGLRRIVACGSVFGMVGSGSEKGWDHVYGSSDVNAFSTPGGCTYAYSKMQSQEAAATLASARGVDLVTLNVGQGCGPALSPDQSNPSWDPIKNLAVPPPGGAVLSCTAPGFVDVRDAAAAHVAALDLPAAAAPRRYPVVARKKSPTYQEIEAILAEVLPERNLPARVDVLPPSAQKLITKGIGLGNKSLGELLSGVSVPPGETLLVDVDPMLKYLVPVPREIKTTLCDWVDNQKGYGHTV